MASHITERSGNSASNAVDQVKNIAASAASSASDAADYIRQHDAEEMGRDVMRAAKRIR
jgi:dihydropteroate synthase